MIPGIWLVRMARWVRRPPSPRMVRLVLLVGCICLALALYGHFFGWPAALTVNGPARLRIR